jgi:hypothetical protein
MARPKRKTPRGRRLPKTALRERNQQLAIEERSQRYISAAGRRFRRNSVLLNQLKSKPARVIIHVLKHLRKVSPSAFQFAAHMSALYIKEFARAELC